MREEDDQLYIYQLYGISVPRRFKAQNTLRNLIGPSAKITQDQIDSAQEVIDKDIVDYGPQVFILIDDVMSAIAAFEQQPDMDDILYEKVTTAFAEIKGQAAMFGNPLASQLANRLSHFLDQYRRFDKDVLYIIRSCCETIKVTYTKNIKSSDMPQARLFLSELEYAMRRYGDKFKKMTGR